MSVELMSLTLGRAAIIQPQPLGMRVLRGLSHTGQHWERAGWGLTVPGSAHSAWLCQCSGRKGECDANVQQAATLWS